MKSFYIKQKVFSIGDKYNIYDTSSNIKYYVKGQVFTIGAKLRLYRAGFDDEIYFIKRKIFSFLPKYELYQKDCLVATIYKKFSVFSHKVFIESTKGIFTITGDFMSHDFVICMNDKEVASLQKKWFTFGDSYEISIYDDENYEFYLALVITIDNCIHNENNQQ